MILPSATIQLSSTRTRSLSHSPVQGVCHRHSKSPKTQILQGTIAVYLDESWEAREKNSDLFGEGCVLLISCV